MKAFLIPMSLVCLVFASPYWFVIRSGYGIKFIFMALLALFTVSQIHILFERPPSLENQTIYYYVYQYSRLTDGLSWLFLTYQAVFLVLHWGYILFYRKSVPHPWYMGTLPLSDDAIPSGISNITVLVIFAVIALSYSVDHSSVYHVLVTLPWVCQHCL